MFTHSRRSKHGRQMYDSSRLTKVSQLNLRDPSIARIPRAGVLFYTFIEDEFYLCFGKDLQSGDLTDFGGGRKKGEDPIRCAVREGNEESRFAFSEIQPDQVQGFLCLHSPQMLIIFIPVVPPDDIDILLTTQTNFLSKQFLNQRQIRSRCFNEISEIVWLSEREIDQLFTDRPTLKVFSKVRQFIYSCIEFAQSSTIMRNIFFVATGRSYKAIKDRFSSDVIKQLLRTL